MPRYTLHIYTGCSGNRYGIVCDSVPYPSGAPRDSRQSRGYSPKEAADLASWLESRATGYAAPDSRPIYDMVIDELSRRGSHPASSG